MPPSLFQNHIFPLTHGLKTGLFSPKHIEKYTPLSESLQVTELLKFSSFYSNKGEFLVELGEEREHYLRTREILLAKHCVTEKIFDK